MLHNGYGVRILATRVYVYTHYRLTPRCSRSDGGAVMEVNNVRGQRAAAALHAALSRPGRIEVYSFPLRVN